MVAIFARRAPALGHLRSPWSKSAFTPFQQFSRNIQTLEQNKNIYVHNLPTLSTPLYALSFLPTPPPKLNRSLILGTSSANPPTPQSFTENPRFRGILMEVLAEHAQNDKDVIDEAYSLWGATMGVSGLSHRHRQVGHRDSKSSEGAPAVGGWHNVVDRRSPYLGGMRIPEPDDILGSLQVASDGGIVGGWQPCESYRLITRDGLLTLTPYLQAKLVERLEKEEKAEEMAGNP